jgi:hypothetical protein
MRVGILGNGWESYDIKILSHFYILVEILVDLGVGKDQGLKVHTSTSEAPGSRTGSRHRTRHG